MNIKKSAFKYVLESSKSNYTVQTLATTKILEDLGEEKCIEILSLSVTEFCEKYSPNITKDYMYKNDFLTPRNAYLINPLYYLYYTYLVFCISEEYINNNGDLDFSMNNLHVFYAGYYTKKKIDKNFTRYYDSYRNFQEKREEYSGKSAIKIDIKDFFDSIKLSNLFSKLYRTTNSKRYVEELEFLLKYCGFDVLPQFNYSIASSILSQIYLQDFDKKIQEYLPGNVVLIRYVDDMYFINTMEEDLKEFNIWLNSIIHYLWEDSLQLNTTKTKVLSEEEYQIHIQLPENTYGNQVNSHYIKLIDEKSSCVVSEGDFYNMIMDLCAVEEEFGIDMMKYEHILKEYLSIDGDYTNKVLKDIIYTFKWKDLEFGELEDIFDNWKFILFNPLHFTVLYIMIKKYLNEIHFINENKIKEIIDYLVSNDTLKFRDLIVGVTYLLQTEFKENEILNKIKESDPKFTDYINKYLI